jgi:hypothetical protein
MIKTIIVLYFSTSEKYLVFKKDTHLVIILIDCVLIVLCPAQEQQMLSSTLYRNDKNNDQQSIP